MATLTTEAQTSPTAPLFTVPITKISKIKAIEIDNPTANAISIKFVDKFVPSPSINNTNPTEVSETKKVVTVQANTHFSETELDIDILGSLWVIASADDSNVVITVTFMME